MKKMTKRREGKEENRKSKSQRHVLSSSFLPRNSKRPTKCSSLVSSRPRAGFVFGRTKFPVCSSKKCVEVRSHWDSECIIQGRKQGREL